MSMHFGMWIHAAKMSFKPIQVSDQDIFWQILFLSTHASDYNFVVFHSLGNKKYVKLKWWNTEGSI